MSDTTQSTFTIEGVGSGTITTPISVAVNAAWQTVAIVLQGLWYNAPAQSESGWGINVARQGEVIFATWVCL